MDSETVSTARAMDNTLRKLRIWRAACVVVTLVALPIVLFLTYAVIDQGVSLTYRAQNHADLDRSLSRLARLFPRTAYDRKDILFLLRKQNPDGFIVESDCAVQIESLRFEFDRRGKLRRIETSAETSPEYSCVDA